MVLKYGWVRRMAVVLGLALDRILLISGMAVSLGSVKAPRYLKVVPWPSVGWMIAVCSLEGSKMTRLLCPHVWMSVCSCYVSW